MSRFSEVRQMVRDELPNRLGLGTVVSTDLRGTRSVSVRLSGGRVCTRTLTCTDDLAPGDEVIVARMEGRDRLIVLAKIWSLYSSFTTATSAILAPPNNLTVTGGPGLFIVEWDDYPGEVLCWQVQYNTADQEAGATDALVTRGSYYLYEVVDSSTDSGDEVTLYFRVRAIRWLGDNNVMYSAWSAWTTGTSATWDGRYYRENELSSHDCDGLHGASLIWICDADDNFPSNVSNVEQALDYLAETGGGVHNLLSATHPDTVAAAAAQGYVVRGNATPKWERYDAATNHFVLIGDGNDITSKAFDWDDVGAGAGADMVHDHSSAAEGDTLAASVVWLIDDLDDVVSDVSDPYNHVQDWFDTTQSAGRLSDGAVTAHAYAITGVTPGGAGAGEFEIANDHTAAFPAGVILTVSGSTGNDGDYTVSAGGATFAGGTTTIPVDEAVPNAVADGNIAAGTVDVAYGAGLIKVADSHIAGTRFFDWAATTTPLIPTNDTSNWVYLDYNGGSPIVGITDDHDIITRNDIFVLDRLWREDSTLYIIGRGQNAYNVSMRAHRNLTRVFHFQRGNGVRLTEKGTRKVGVSAGNIYRGLNEIPIAKIDTSVAGTFTTLYRDGGGGWTQVTGQTTIDNTNYDDGSGVLEPIVNNQYGVYWAYIDYGGGLHIQYGQDSYHLGEAEVAQFPATRTFLDKFAMLIAKIVVEEGALENFYSIEYPWDVKFVGSPIANHNNLGGLQGGTTAEYYHFTSAQHTVLTGTTDGAALVGTGAAIELTTTPTWEGLHTFVAGITFSGASGANIVTVPDNAAEALNLVDAGALEHIRIISTDTGPNVAFFPSEGGRVGIGTPVPSADFLLEARNTGHSGILITTTSNAQYARFRVLAVDNNYMFEAFQFGSTYAGNDTIGVANAGLALLYTGAETTNLVFRTQKSTASILFGADTGTDIDMIIQNGGNVGIGTGSPDNPLELLSTTTPQFRITHTDATDYATFSVDGDGQLDITTVDGGGAGGHICLLPDGNVGIRTTAPLTLMHTKETSIGAGDAVIRLEGHGNNILHQVLGRLEWYNADTSAAGPNVVAKIEAQTVAAAGYGGDLVFYTGNATTTPEVMRVLGLSGYVGIATTAPGQILDCNAGSGNMIADGYDNHPSWLALKVDPRPMTDVLAKFKQVIPYEYRRTPYVSADELAQAAIAEFGQERWDELFPEGHRGSRIKEIPDSKIQAFVDSLGDQLRAERSTLPEWQRKHYSLVIDDLEDTFPDIISHNDEGEASGYSLNSYVGLLHACITELVGRVEQLEAM